MGCVAACRSGAASLLLVRSDRLRAVTTKKSGETQTGSTPFGHTPLQGRAHLVNRAELHDEAGQGPGSLDPKTLAAPKAKEARRWLAKTGMELEVPANWKFLGTSKDGRNLAFLSDTTGDVHAIELFVCPMPEDLDADAWRKAQLEQLDEAKELKRVNHFEERTLGQVKGLLVVGWGPESRDALQATSDEDLYLATDGTGRRALSWRGVVDRELEKGKERQLVIVALSSPIESFPDARPVYDAMLDRLGIWA
jgi:hypothetical protein